MKSSENDPLETYMSEVRRHPLLTIEEERDLTRRYAETLEGRDRLVWDKRIRAEAPLTLRELGVEIGVTGERVRMLEFRIRRNLKRWLRRHLPDLIDD